MEAHEDLFDLGDVEGAYTCSPIVSTGFLMGYLYRHHGSCAS